MGGSPARGCLYAAAAFVLFERGGAGPVNASLAARPRPRGHGRPFGGWRAGLPVAELPLGKMPRPREFFESYCEADGGYGRPLVLRGAARRMAAMHWADDDFLLQAHGQARIGDVEIGLKETRASGPAAGFRRMASFLKAYNHSDLYLVSPIPPSMQREVELLPLLACGGFLDFLGAHKIWMGRGGSSSVVHHDEAENLNCLLAGRKRFSLVHPRWRAEAEGFPNAASPDPNRFGFTDARLDAANAPGYGAFFGQLDADAVDLVRFPGWRAVRWHVADLRAGDCIYIPQGWYHQVRAGPTKTVNAHLWFWRPLRFDAASCAPAKGRPRRLRFSDCTWGYMPPRPKVVGAPPRGVARGSRVTRCSPRGLHRARRPLRGEL